MSGLFAILCVRGQVLFSRFLVSWVCAVLFFVCEESEKEEEESWRWAVGSKNTSRWFSAV